ncbi:MAG TPA: DJ-1/PfpI family protein [Euzebyales bacterium]
MPPPSPARAPRTDVPGRDRRAGVTSVGLLLFDGCDVIDVAGPYEVLLTANRLVTRRGGDAPFAVDTHSVDGEPVTGFGGLGLSPSRGAIAEAGPLDVLIVPGLIDLGAIADMAEVTETVCALDPSVDIVVGVCTGAFLLHAAGVLGDAAATTHWEDVRVLDELRDGGSTRDDVRWVDAGHVVTSGGMTSGIAMALHLVERLVDGALAQATAAQIDYVWTEQRPTS